MTEKELVQEWIKAGAKIKEGIRLFLNLRGNTPAGRLVSRNKEVNSGIAVRALLRIAGVSEDSIVVVKPQEVIRPVTIEATPAAPKFREQFPFLSDPACPPELKILAADKITAYRNAVVAHQRLIDCKDVNECAAMARTIVDNWIENDACFDELRYYGEMRRVLGKHRIFDEMKRLQELRKSSAKDIFKRRENIIGKINRIKYEIKKADKPHLLAERERRLREAEFLLAETDKIIEGL
ncbi:MAG: hypothetical protein LBN27_12280 [Prevotellaceae bacterium]|jgi:hypothetical protein|nr:hypothetical protein [Prevotellaceae bacterium]